MNCLSRFFTALCLAIIFVSAMSVPALAASQAEQWNQATLKWQMVSGAASYNIYFKETGQGGFTHALSVPNGATNYTIRYLKKGRSYQYAIMAVDDTGKEYMTTGMKRMVPVAMHETSK